MAGLHVQDGFIKTVKFFHLYEPASKPLQSY